MDGWELFVRSLYVLVILFLIGVVILVTQSLAESWRNRR